MFALRCGAMDQWFFKSFVEHLDISRGTVVCRANGLKNNELT